MTMADPIIELQELLNRASGPGKISPDSPLETRLYGANGQPIGTAGNPLQVKAHDTDAALGQIKDALGPLATETKLEAVRALLAALEGKDFATQTTLAQVKQVLDTLNGAVSTSAGQADIQQAIAALAGIVAKESTLGQAKGALDVISGKVATDQGVGLVASAVEALAQIAATESTLSQAVQKLESIVSRLQNTLTVDGEVQLKGSNLALRQTMVTGAKTVASTAAEIFAGSSRLAGRHAMVVTNTGTDIVYIGTSDVTTSNGFPLVPQDTLRIEFDPTSSVGMFACTSGPNVQVRVVELA